MHRPIALSAVLLWMGGGHVRAHGDLHESITAADAAISNSPGDAALFLRRAELYRMHGEWDRAEADYLHATALHPGLSTATFGLAQLRVAQQRDRDAMPLLDAFLATNPGHAEGRALRAALLEKKGQWQKAVADLDVACASSVESCHARERAKMLERHGQIDAAVRSLDEMNRLHGRVPALEQQALDIEERAGRYDAALKRVQHLLQTGPRPEFWLARKATLLGKASRHAEARTVWAEAMAAFQKMPERRRALASNADLAAQIAAGLVQANHHTPTP